MSSKSSTIFLGNTKIKGIGGWAIESDLKEKIILKDVFCENASEKIIFKTGDTVKFYYDEKKYLEVKIVKVSGNDLECFRI